MVRSVFCHSLPTHDPLRQLANCALSTPRTDAQTTTDAVSALTLHADLRPMPFVVVLVDGDSYSFLGQTKSSGSEGTEIAHRLHREVSKYILSHPRIPPHSKIVVRVFCNRSSLQGKLVKAPKARVKGDQPIPRTETTRQPSLTMETLVKFAETCEY